MIREEDVDVEIRNERSSLGEATRRKKTERIQTKYR
jgi:hypothetical protein